ncbi:hypothetical protein Tco_1315887 [Tanacetum coccineum]
MEIERNRLLEVLETNCPNLEELVGVGVLPGLIPVVVCGRLNVPFAGELQKFQLQFMRAQDKSLKSTSEILNNMKIIKLQSW